MVLLMEMYYAARQVSHGLRSICLSLHRGGVRFDQRTCYRSDDFYGWCVPWRQGLSDLMGPYSKRS